MPVDSLSESVSIYAPTIPRETECTDIESSCGLGTGPGGGSTSGVSETILARFEQTITQDRPRLLWQAQRIVGRREIAEEIVQESLLKAFRALPRFRGESRMRTWLYAIVRNTTLEHLRDQREHLYVSLEDLFDGDGMSVYDPPDSRNSPEDHCKTAELQTILRDEVDGLGPCCRGAFQMCILDENTQSEAAATFKVSVAKIKSRVFRAKRILSSRVRRRAGFADLVPDQNGDGEGQHKLDQLTSRLESTPRSAMLNRDYIEAETY